MYILVLCEKMCVRALLQNILYMSLSHIQETRDRVVQGEPRADYALYKNKCIHTNNHRYYMELYISFNRCSRDLVYAHTYT